MKAEVKQVFRGVSYAAQAAAAAAEAQGEFAAYAVGFTRTSVRAVMMQTVNSAEQKVALQKLLTSNKFEDKIAAGDLAAHCLFEKWSAE